MPIILSKQSLKAITDANIGKDNVKKFLQKVDKKNKTIHFDNFLNKFALFVKDINNPKPIKAEQPKPKKQEPIESLECCVCLSDTKNILLQPCNHLCVCESCKPNVGDECPICRTIIQSTIKVYL